jgi:hypothetical protein
MPPAEFDPSDKTSSQCPDPVPAASPGSVDNPGGRAAETGDFGVLVAVHRSDYDLAKGCCASIRTFLGDVPIALFVDGGFSTRAMERAYGVQVIRATDLTIPELRRIGFGWGRTKMAAFWEAPFETALFLDADTIVYGDVRAHADFDMADVVTDTHFAQTHARCLGDDPLARFLGPHEASVATMRTHLQSWFFRPDLVERRYPDFDWRGALTRIFCPGGMFARRGVLDLEDYLRLDRDRRDGSGIFSVGDMGVLNFLVLDAAAKGRLRLRQTPLLHRLVFQSDPETLRREFPVGSRGRPCPGENASILHWSGYPKPSLGGKAVYSEPVTYFRHKAHADAGLRPAALVDAVLLMEDLMRRAALARKHVAGALIQSRADGKPVEEPAGSAPAAGPGHVQARRSGDTIQSPIV